MNTGAYIQASGLSKVFATGQQTTTALSNLNFSVAPGEFVCLLGPSGCGKSSLLQILNGLEPPSSGTISIGASTPQKNMLPVGMVFQNHGLFPWMTLLENIRFIVSNQPHLSAVDPLPHSQHILQQVGLGDFYHYLPHQVSGGMKQRASIARCFAIEPELMLMDEPFVFLDYQTRIQVQQILLRLWQSSTKTVVFVTHDIEEAVLLADRILVMSARPGTIREEIPVTLERPRDLLSLKHSQEFHALVQQATALIQDELTQQVPLA